MSTPKNPGPITPSRSTTSTGRRSSNATPTVSTPAPVLTNAVQKPKMSWYHISDVKKTDIVTKLICQLPDYDAFGSLGKLGFNPE